MAQDETIPDQPALPPDRPKPALPGNHGQFGEGDATEDYKTLEDHPSPAEPPSQGPNQTNAGERS